MPKITVLVEKDDAGKLWNYVFLQDESNRVGNLLAAPTIIVHKSESSNEKSDTSEKTESMKDYITIGALPPREKMRQKVRKQHF